jgi:hypothetical protein
LVQCACKKVIVSLTHSSDTRMGDSSQSTIATAPSRTR